MTASTSTVVDLRTLDGRIARALAGLRLARAASARSGNPNNLGAEARAEIELNALLDDRYAVVHRASTPRA